ncbi:MAG TPA: hypothetical protein VM513_21850 [Kofleriaceae bacterium]|jgi:hypothetical protein|nr:hypothetical protein [Kofleriaceae bacterium]
MVIRIKRHPKHAAITVPNREVEPTDEIKLRLIAWLVSDIGRRVDVEEIELCYEPDDRTDTES